MDHFVYINLFVSTRGKERGQPDSFPFLFSSSFSFKVTTNNLHGDPVSHPVCKCPSLLEARAHNRNFSGNVLFYGHILFVDRPSNA
jgi:hypothetical protein